MSTCPILLLGVLAAVAQSACECSLNGVCESGKCVCDVPWSGIDCAYPLALKKDP